jgi:two-component system LytT family response regulator
MRVLLVDDNPQVREMVKSILYRSFTDVEVAGEADNAADGLALLRYTPADVWILDIELGDGNIFSVLEQAPPERLNAVCIIFLTAFSTREYMLKALRQSAIDYLLKPVDPDLLKEALEKVRHRKPDLNLSQRLDELKSLISKDQGVLPNGKVPFFLPRGAVQYVEIQKIMYLEGEEMLTHVQLSSDERLTSTRNLGFYKNLLLRDGLFLLASKKYLVNTHYIDKYEPDGHRLLLTDGSALTVSRRGGKGILDFFRGLFG